MGTCHSCFKNKNATTNTSTDLRSTDTRENECKHEIVATRNVYVDDVLTRVCVPELSKRVNCLNSTAFVALIDGGSTLQHEPRDWLALANKHVLNSVVYVRNLGNAKLWEQCNAQAGPRLYPVFDAHTLFVQNCDKNFVYFWIRKSIFPRVHTIFTDSTCEGIPMLEFTGADDVVIAEVGTPGTTLLPGALLTNRIEWPRDSQCVNVCLKPRTLFHSQN